MEIQPAGKEAEAMDFAAAPARATAGKKQAKPKKVDKDITKEERWAESSKHACRREIAKAQNAAAKLEEEQLGTSGRIIAHRQHANDEQLAHKATQQAIMMMQQETLNVAN
jgi:predicted  nucleic acid-binding Zn-ribbon protein